MFLAAAAGIRPADVFHHLQHSRDELQLLARLAADPVPLLTTIGAALVLVGEIMLDGLTGEMCRKRVPSPAAATMFSDDSRIAESPMSRLGICACGFRICLIKDLQLLRIDAIAAWAVPAAEQMLDVVLQLLHALLKAGDRGLLLVHALVAETGIIGMREGVRAHAPVIRTSGLMSGR